MRSQRLRDATNFLRVLIQRSKMGGHLFCYLLTHKNRIVMRLFSCFIITKTTPKTTLLFLKAFTHKVNASFFTPYIASLLLSFFFVRDDFSFHKSLFHTRRRYSFRERSRAPLLGCKRLRDALIPLSAFCGFKFTNQNGRTSFLHPLDRKSLVVIRFYDPLSKRHE